MENNKKKEKLFPIKTAFYFKFLDCFFVNSCKNSLLYQKVLNKKIQ